MFNVDPPRHDPPLIFFIIPQPMNRYRFMEFFLRVQDELFSFFFQGILELNILDYDTSFYVGE